MASLFARCDCDLYEALANEAFVDQDVKVWVVALKEAIHAQNLLENVKLGQHICLIIELRCKTTAH